MVYAEAIRAGRKARGRRAVDLLIAATALSFGMPLYAANVDDFAGLDEVIELKAVAERPAA